MKNDLQILKNKVGELDKVQQKIASLSDNSKIDRLRDREVALKLEIKKMARNMTLSF